MSDPKYAEHRSDNLYGFGYLPFLTPWYQVLLDTGIIAGMPAFLLPSI